MGKEEKRKEIARGRREGGTLRDETATRTTVVLIFSAAGHRPAPFFFFVPRNRAERDRAERYIKYSGSKAAAFRCASAPKNARLETNRETARCCGAALPRERNGPSEWNNNARHRPPLSSLAEKNANRGDRVDAFPSRSRDDTFGRIVFTARSDDPRRRSSARLPRLR